MRPNIHPSASVMMMAITTFVAVGAALFITYGIGIVVIVTVVLLLLVSYLVHRHEEANPPTHYPRHGDRMD